MIPLARVTWEDEAQCEFSCSALRYAKRGDRDLAERFVSGVEAAIIRIRLNPQLFRLFSRDARKVKVDHFPYAVVYWYEESQDHIHIIAVAHLSREPGYWRERLD